MRYEGPDAFERWFADHKDNLLKPVVDLYCGRRPFHDPKKSEKSDLSGAENEGNA